MSRPLLRKSAIRNLIPTLFDDVDIIVRPPSVLSRSDRLNIYVSGSTLIRGSVMEGILLTPDMKSYVVLYPGI